MFYAFNLRKARKILYAIVILAIIVILGINALQTVLPLKYYDTILKYSTKYSLEPAFVCAIINAESKFKANAQSHKGARGLMQILQITGDWGASELGLENYDYSRIFEPEINIEIGCWYISKLINQYGDTDTALAAYNAGSGTVSRWLQESEGSQSLNVQYKETENYIKKVNAYTIAYSLLLRIGRFYER